MAKFSPSEIIPVEIVPCPPPPPPVLICIYLGYTFSVVCGVSVST